MEKYHVGDKIEYYRKAAGTRTKYKGEVVEVHESYLTVLKKDPKTLKKHHHVSLLDSGVRVKKIISHYLIEVYLYDKKGSLLWATNANRQGGEQAIKDYFMGMYSEDGRRVERVEVKECGY